MVGRVYVRVRSALSSWPGHHAPLVLLGWALGAAGHDVRALCDPRPSGAAEPGRVPT
ncbi:hypothetical protein [Actinophytocola xanthii]|nr:hypothetical protein [Actinophytocola xanthii]